MKHQQIAIGLIIDQQQNILISKRHKNKHLGGLWEFAGGKVEAGESIEDALKRELKEELAIDIKKYRPFIQITHTYVAVKVTLHCFLINRYKGKPIGNENQQIQWQSIQQLDLNLMPEANKAIIQALQLPDQYLITANVQPEILQHIEKNLKRGIKLIQLRQKSSPIEPMIAKKALVLCHQYQAKLLINQDIQLAKTIQADGVHLTSKQLGENMIKDCKNLLIGVSCHNLNELKQAQTLGVHFAVLSPVLPTQTHPEAKPLGLKKFKSFINQINLPVYGLGGLSISELSEIQQIGGQGIAGIRCFDL